MASGDRAALVDLFQSTGGTRWNRKGNWDTDAALSHWPGVFVNDDGRVVVLDLFQNNLEGTIPEAIGALTELKALYLNHNKLTGRIPEVLRALRELTHLDLSNNQLTGSIPAWLGSLKKLQQLGLDRNHLGGSIPEELGALKELTFLHLYDNKLTGPIPEALGVLKELTHLFLRGNKLTGSIPACLGYLSKLRSLWLNGNQLVGHVPKELGDLENLGELYLHSNHLTGHVPKELGNLKNLEKLYLQNNHLTGVIPIELGNLSNLERFEFRSTGSKAFLRRGNRLTGGPAKGQWLSSWQERIKPKYETKPQNLKGDQREEDAPVPPPSTTPVLVSQQQLTGQGDLKEKDPPVSSYSPRPNWITGYLETYPRDEKQEGTPVSPPPPFPRCLPEQQEASEGDDINKDASFPLGSLIQTEGVVADRAFSAEQASLSAEKAAVDRRFRAQLSSSAGLDLLIRDNPEALEDVQRVIEAPAAGSFYLDNELSDMGRCRKLGTLVTMATALSEVALKHTEDMDVHRREQALAPFSKAYYNAVRTGLCNAYLAASVIDSDWVSTSKTGGMGKAGAALKLMSSAVSVAGGLPELVAKALEAGDHYLQTRRLVKITAMAPDTVECCSLARRLALQLTDGLKDDTGMMDDEADELRVHTTAGMKGGSGSGRGADMAPGDMSEDEVFEYLLEEVTSYERNDDGGKQLGKKHLRKLLKAIQRGCLAGSNCTEQKIEILLLEILPEADVRPTATSSTPKEAIDRSPPVVAPAHDRELPSRIEFAAMQAALESLKLDRETQRAELEELQAAKDKQQEELKAMESGNKKLQRKVETLEKRVPDGDCELCDTVNAGGGQVLKQKLEIKEDLETFWQRKETAAGARDQGTLTLAEHQVDTRDTRARVDDVDDRVDFMEARLAALEQQQAGKKKGFSQRRRRHR